MTDFNVTLELLQRLSVENKTEELQVAISLCCPKTLRSFCRSLGVRIRSKKHEAYPSKADYEKLLAKRLAVEMAAKKGDGASSAAQMKKKSYVRLLNMILLGITTPALLEIMTPSQEEIEAGEEAATAADRALTGDEQGLIKTLLEQIAAYVRAVNKGMKPKHLKASIELTRRLLTEISPPVSEATRMIHIELVSYIKRLKCWQQNERRKRAAVTRRLHLRAHRRNLLVPMLSFRLYRNFEWGPHRPLPLRPTTYLAFYQQH
ncbi:hypothetical protein PRNP1_000214 [Phytophthora ramorum]